MGLHLSSARFRLQPLKLRILLKSRLEELKCSAANRMTTWLRASFFAYIHVSGTVARALEIRSIREDLT